MSYFSGDQISAVGLEDVLEAARQDSNHRDGNVAEFDLATDDRGSALKRGATTIADDDDKGAVGLIVRWLEVPSERRLHTQHAEEVRADELTVEPLRFCDAGQRRLHGMHDRHRLERASPRDELAKRAERDIQAGSPWPSQINISGRASG